jgi:hypothetical protein
MTSSGSSSPCREDNEVVRTIGSTKPEIVEALGLQINSGEPEGGEMIGRKDSTTVKKKGKVPFAVGRIPTLSFS